MERTAEQSAGALRLLAERSAQCSGLIGGAFCGCADTRTTAPHSAPPPHTHATLAPLAAPRRTSPPALSAAAAMVLSYLRWEADAASNFGLVASPGCNGVVFLKSSGLALTGCGEAVAVWHLKQGALLARLQPEGHEYEGVGAKIRAQVTCLVAHPREVDLIAAGYSDGSIRLWSIASRTSQVTLQGHRGIITSLCFSADGSRLYSGGADTDIIAWDVVGETGLFRLRGHKAPLTSMLLLESKEGGAQHNHLVSGAKDQLVKVWDLSTQACVQTIVGHRAEVTALATTRAEKLLVSGAAEGPLRVWHIHATGRNDPVPHPAPAPAAKEKKITVKLEPGVAAPNTAASASSSAAAAASSSSSSSSSSLFSAAEGSVEILSFWGFLPRESHKRVTGLEFWPARSAEPTLLLALSADKQLDLFHVRPTAEIEKKVKRRIKRQREKQKKHAANGTEKPAMASSSAAAAKTEAGDSDMPDASDPASATDASNGAATTAIPIDQFQSLLPLRTSVKIVSCAASSSAAHLRVLLSMQDNSVQVWSIDLAGARSSMDEREEKGETGATSSSALAAASPHYTQLYNLTSGGHRTGVRVVALSSDGSVCMTASSEQIKIWNVVSKSCIRTIDSGYALCGFFVPGSRHVLIGTKAGEIELYDLSTGSCLQKIAAHGPLAGSAVPTPVYALDLRPDQRGFVSGGGDKELKVWDFELVMMQWDTETAPQRSLQIVHTKTLKLTDDILAVRCSPDGKLIAVGLLDSTIKVFYADSLKFFLSLYGHKLPVLSIDISSDSNLLVSGSADKNLKLWGLDFGDCHKSMFGHGDSVTAVRFLRGTHQFWSAGKDKLLKLWDGDTFEMIQVIEAHTAEVWGIAINHQGTMALTVGNDKSVRVIRQSDQQLFLEEERETRLEKVYDAGATTEAKAMGDMAGSGIGAAEGASSSALVARKGANEDSLKSGERLMEALDLADADVRGNTHSL